MRMNVLLDSPEATPYFTDVSATLLALGVRSTDFDWYMSDIETNLTFEGVPQADGWVTGPDLSLALSHSGLQFIWGVFSAFPRGTRIEVEQPPSADGNSRYWRDADSLEPQLKGALFEVVCWDSSATILVGITPEQAKAYCSVYPMAKQLSEASSDT